MRDALYCAHYNEYNDRALHNTYTLLQITNSKMQRSTSQQRLLENSADNPEISAINLILPIFVSDSDNDDGGSNIGRDESDEDSVIIPETDLEDNDDDNDDDDDSNDGTSPGPGPGPGGAPVPVPSPRQLRARMQNLPSPNARIGVGVGVGIPFVTPPGRARRLAVRRAVYAGIHRRLRFSESPQVRHTIMFGALRNAMRVTEEYKNGHTSGVTRGAVLFDANEYSVVNPVDGTTVKLMRDHVDASADASESPSMGALLKTLMCPICLCIKLRNMSMGCRGGHVVCEECCGKFECHMPEGTVRCPQCREECHYTKIAECGLSNRIVADIPATCHYKSDTCAWKGKLGDATKHYTQDCVHTRVKCTKCLRFVARGTLGTSHDCRRKQAPIPSCAQATEEPQKRKRSKRGRTPRVLPNFSAFQ